MESLSYTPPKTEASLPERRANIAVGKAVLLKLMKSPTSEELAIISLF